ncbi:uncharacterized protein MELLADRAFT_71882 [Melampsora larici-populina 98AG31]|uniref:Uncharacterized protein n=1 Tax=Melampsora larici-populina (strain 98AG31 / pathotype 3-4-7) TaxID=747676 RepID=F4RLP2_MELLP|nr:uncharacterized protein MELLADRAFT_71882 [Melampsora larici-populina 98AG31]EGG06568.1 hypothetical protein MELLADRAFT_71882 [Melampsora larici-populina 98AG31]
MLRTTSDPSCEAFYRKRPRPLSLKSQPTQFFSSHSTPGILDSSITTPILEEDTLNLSLLHTSELPSPKKLRPSRECATIPNGSLKSAFKSPAQSPNTTCPTTPDTDFGGKMSVGIIEMDSAFPFSSARANSPTRKNVHFTCDDTEVDSLSTVMLSIHLTHSPQSYDRSPIDVGPSLLLPPRSSSDLCEESEVECSEEDWSDPELGLDLSRTSSIHQAGIGNLHALNPLALTSALDGF